MREIDYVFTVNDTFNINNANTPMLEGNCVSYFILPVLAYLYYATEHFILRFLQKCQGLTST